MGNTEKREETLSFKAVKANKIASETNAESEVSPEAAAQDTDAVKVTAEYDNVIDNEKDTAPVADKEVSASQESVEPKEEEKPVSVEEDATAEDKADTEEKDDKDDDADDEDEGVVFASFAAPETSAKKKNQRSTAAVHTEEKDDDDGDIVFAVTDKKQKKNNIPRQKKKSKAWVAVAAALVICGAAGAGVTAWMMNRNSAPTAAEVSSDSTEVPGDPASADVSVVSKAPDAHGDASQASEEKPETSGIDTTNILFGKNVTVEGVDLSGKSLTQAYDAMQDKLLEIREPISIAIVCEGKTLTLTQNDFEFDTNLSTVLIQAYHYSRGEINELTVENTYDNGVTNFRVDSQINTESVDAAIKRAADFYDVLPVDAHVTSFDPTATEKFTYADGSDGFMLDHDELSSRIKGILEQPEKKGSFSIEKHLTKFKVTLPEIKANTKLIASHKTTARNVYASNENMKLAIRAASGTVVNPGEIFSFNEMTGDTTNGNVHHYANGVEGSYVPSQAYVQGESRDEFGGGICQAATTIYNCALKANMEVIERHAHMFTVSYAPYGLDSTIDYGNLDMRFKNNYDLPVYIATYVYDYDYDGLEELMVEMYGPLSTEYDEIVPVGWVTYADSKNFSAMGAKVYFKDGKEVDRVNLPRGSYELHYETYYTVINYIPADVDYGPAAYATGEIPTVYSPNGCGKSAPIAYGTAEQVLANAKKEATAPAADDKTSKPSGTVIVAR